MSVMRQEGNLKTKVTRRRLQYRFTDFFIEQIISNIYDRTYMRWSEANFILR